MTYYRRYYSGWHGRNHRQSQNRPKVNDIYKGADDDACKLFFKISDYVFENFAKKYQVTFGEGPSQYLRKNYQLWKSGKKNISPQNRERVLQILPEFLSFSEKFELFKKIWIGYKKFSQTKIKIFNSTNIPQITSIILSKVKHLNESQIPNWLIYRVDWLGEHETQKIEALLHAFDISEAKIILESLIQNLSNIISRVQKEKDFIFQNNFEIEIPGNKIMVDYFFNSNFKEEIIVEENDGRKDIAVVPKDSREIVDLNNHNELLNYALNNVSPEKKDQLLERIVETSVNLKLKQAEAKSDREEITSTINDTLETINENTKFTSKKDQPNISVDREIHSTYGKTKIQIHNKQSCFVATVCYTSPDHPNVLTLRCFRDNVLSRYFLGRVFIKFYYSFGKQFARIISNKPETKKIVKNLLDIIIKKIT